MKPGDGDVTGAASIATSVLAVAASSRESSLIMPSSMRRSLAILSRWLRASPSRSARRPSIRVCTCSKASESSPSRDGAPPRSPVADGAYGLVKALDPVGKEIEARHVVLDPVDALKIAVDDLERLLELLQAGGHRRRLGLARDHEIGGGHDEIERGTGDHARNERDAGMRHQAGRKSGRRDGHGDQDDHVEHDQPSRGRALPGAYDISVAQPAPEIARKS